MAAKGVAKLIEECGELQQVLGKRLAYWTTDEHPDGSNLTERLQDEMADVMAAITFVGHRLNLDWDAIEDRRYRKWLLFCQWDEDPSNNTTSIERVEP